MNWIRKDLIPVFVLILISFLIFIPYLGHVNLFNWDEIQYAESAREMLETNDFYTVRLNYIPQTEKPPLYIWMQAVSMQIFGVNAFAARFPNALAGLFTLLALFFTGRKLYDQKFAILWIVSMLGSVLPVIYFKSALIDPWFNLFLFLGIINYCKIYYTKKTVNKGKQMILSALFIALAIVTKGPVALYILLLIALLLFVFNRFKLPVNFFQGSAFILTLLIVAGSWFLIASIAGKEDIVRSFFQYQSELLKAQTQGERGLNFYTWLVLLLGMFPAVIYALRGFSTIQNNSMNQIIVKQTMVILLFTILLYSLFIQTRFIQYTSLAYFPISFLAAYAAYKMGNNKYRNRKWIAVTVVFFGLLLATAAILVSYYEANKSLFLSKINIDNPYILESLKTSVAWSGKEWLIGAVLLLGLLLYALIGTWNYSIAYWNLNLFTLLFTLLALHSFSAKIEKYTQKAAIDFYKKKAHEDCYVTTLGYKDYAHLFYTKKNLPDNTESLNKRWLLTGNVDKPVYVVMKSDKKELLKMRLPTLIILHEESGYVFCKRN